MKYIITIILTLFIIGIAFADVVFSDFQATPIQENRILIEWSTIIETGIKEYHVQRSFDRYGNYSTVSSEPIKAIGPGNYQYEDIVSLKSTVSRVYYYRLKIINFDGTVNYSDIVRTFSHVSSARQTWGKLKAMFH